MNEPRPEFMAEAIRLATEGVRANMGGPFGCVIVRDDLVLARGFNQVVNLNDPTAHAEIVAIRQACRAINSFQLTDCDLYTSCEPCPMCLGAIYWARPRRVIYANTRQDAADIGFDDDFIYQELRLPIEQRAIPMRQLMRDEGWSAFEEWRAKADRTEY